MAFMIENSHIQPKIPIVNMQISYSIEMLQVWSIVLLGLYCVCDYIIGQTKEILDV